MQSVRHRGRPLRGFIKRPEALQMGPPTAGSGQRAATVVSRCRMDVPPDSQSRTIIGLSPIFTLSVPIFFHRGTGCHLRPTLVPLRCFHRVVFQRCPTDLDNEFQFGPWRYLYRSARGHHSPMEIFYNAVQGIRPAPGLARSQPHGPSELCWAV